MRKNLFLGLLLTLALVFTSSAQDISRLEKLADEIRIQAEDLVDRTEKEIKKEGLHSSLDIRSAFLAKQFRSSILLFERIVDDKFKPSEMRYAGMVLKDLSGHFPNAGPYYFEWQKARDSIGELSRELRGLNNGASIEKARYPAYNGGVIGRAIWRGTVDSDVILTVKGSQISSRALSGIRYPEGEFSFSSNLPAQSRMRVGVNIRKGRGKVHVMQQPSRENNYTAIVQIRDEQEGSRAYSLEIYWYRR